MSSIGPAAGFFRPEPAKATPYALLLRLSAEDRELLVRLTHSRGQTASAVIRDLLRAAVPPPEDSP